MADNQYSAPEPSRNPDLFKIQTPCGSKWVLYLILFILLNLGIYFFQNFLLFFIVAICIDIILVPVQWNKISVKIIRRYMYKGLNSQKKSGFGLLFGLLGLKKVPTRTYFIEGRGKSLNLNAVGTVYRQRIFDVISACIGFGFILAISVRYIFEGVLDYNKMLGIAILSLFFMPLLLFWFIPIIWTLKDADVRAIDAQFNIINLGDEMKLGFLRRFLGFAAIITGVGFFSDLGDAFWSGQMLGGTIIGVYFMSIVFVCILIATIGGVASLICIIYLTKYHEKIVNACRGELAKLIPVKYSNAIDKDGNPVNQD